jgi:hypothetical protein
MKKIILISAILLFSTGAFAQVWCNNGSLKGTYSYEVSGVNQFPLPPTGTFVTRSTSVVGQVHFDGHGKATFSGIGSAAGIIRTKIGNGQYLVKNNCTATGNLVWQSGDIPSQFSIILDHVDNKPRPYIAYHGVVLATDPGVASASGSITKVIDEFHH